MGPLKREEETIELEFPQETPSNLNSDWIFINLK